MYLSYLLIVKIMSMFLIVLTGYAMVKLGVASIRDVKALNTVSLYSVMPTCILNAFMVEFTADRAEGLLITVAAAIIIHIFYIFIAKISGKAFGFTVTERGAIIYSNAGNLIIPLVMSVLGPEWVFYTCGYMLVQTMLFFTHGILLLGGKGANVSLKKIVENPNTLACMAGMILFLTGVKLPVPVEDMVASLGGMIGPISMLIIGMNLSDVRIGVILKNKRNYIVAFFRLVILPIVVIAGIYVSRITVIIPMSKQALYITMLAASAPVAATVVLLADQYGNDGVRASELNVMSLLFCIFTMPLMSLIYQTIC